MWYVVPLYKRAVCDPCRGEVAGGCYVRVPAVVGFRPDNGTLIRALAPSPRVSRSSVGGQNALQSTLR